MSDDSSKKPKNKIIGQWGPLAAILMVITGLILGEVFGGLIMGGFAALADAFSLINMDTWFETTQAQFLFVLLSSVCSILVLWLFIHWRKIGWRTLGFVRKPMWSDLGLGVVAAPIYFVLLILFSAFAGVFLGIDVQQEQEIGFDQVIGASALAMTFISLVIIPPVVEEILFRGFLFTGLRSKINFVWATLITSMLFAIPHLFASSQGLLWIAAVDTFTLSLVLCYLREQTGNLWAPIVLHALKNGAAFVFIFIIGQ